MSKDKKNVEKKVEQTKDIPKVEIEKEQKKQELVSVVNKNSSKSQKVVKKRSSKIKVEVKSKVKNQIVLNLSNKPEDKILVNPYSVIRIEIDSSMFTKLKEQYKGRLVIKKVMKK